MTGEAPDELDTEALAAEAERGYDPSRIIKVTGTLRLPDEFVAAGGWCLPEFSVTRGGIRYNGEPLPMTPAPRPPRLHRLRARVAHALLNAARHRDYDVVANETDSW